MAKGVGYCLTTALREHEGAGAAARPGLGEAAGRRRTRGSLLGRSGVCRVPGAALLCVSEERGASGRSLRPRASLGVSALADRSNLMAAWFSASLLRAFLNLFLFSF